MSRTCEVCASRHGKAPACQPSPGKARRVLIEDRIVSLCEQHAARFRLSGKDSLCEFLALFPEANGRRSLISRRAPLDRRVFPARPEGRRHNTGRRVSDHLD